MEDRLRSLDDHKLMDIVRNYRQYGYDAEVRATALRLLEERGITTELLALSGQLENTTYTSAESLFRSFSRHSMFAFILYILILLIRIAPPLLSKSNPAAANWILIGTIVLILFYLIFLIQSMRDQMQFYKVIGENYQTEAALLYLLVGMPLYIVMYFFFQNQMREKMRSVR